MSSLLRCVLSPRRALSCAPTIGTIVLERLPIVVSRTLQQLDVMRRLARRRPDVEFELYWVAIPQDAVLPEPSSMFDEAYMRALVKLGQEMGARPGSWHTESPLLELDWESAGHSALLGH